MIMEMRLPRTLRHCAASRPSRLSPWKSNRSAVTWPAVRPRMARTDCDLPEPDSPTIASFSRPMLKDMSRTTCEMPVGVLKRMLRLSTCKRGVVIAASPSLLTWIEHIAQAITDQIEAETDDEDGDAGEG